MVHSWLEDPSAFRELLSSLVADSKLDSLASEMRCRELQQIAKSANKTVHAAYLGSLRADALCDLGRLGEAYSEVSDALPILREENDPEFIARALSGLGLIQNELGDRGAAVQSFIESLNVAKEHGIVARERSAQLNIGFIYYLENCPDEALEHFRLVVGADPGDHISGLATSNISSILIDTGKLDEARLLIEAGLDHQNSPYIQGLLCGNFAMILAHQGDESAWQMAERSVEHLLSCGKLNYSPVPFHDIARVYFDHGLGEQALNAVSRAGALSDLQTSRPYADEIRLLRAKILTLTGNHAEACQLLLKEVDGLQTKFADQMKLRLELSQQRWEADWARKEADLLRTVNVELTEARRVADRANAIKSQFLANMSHEIRTPLHGVIGLSALILETDVSSVTRDHVGSIKSSGESLLSLLNDILDLSKIEADKMSLHIREFNVEDAIDDVLATMQSRAIEKNLEFFAMIETDVPRRLLGDPDRIKQIWTNLVGNAIKFTASGSVTIHLSWKGSDHGPGTLFSAVRDTGVGISEDVQETIFESFSQASVTTSSEYGGTGLGLTISRRLAVAMGGGLAVHSVPGEGATFTFGLPAEAVSSRVDQPLQEAACVILGETDLAARSLSLMVRALGFTPVVAANLEELSMSGNPLPLVFASDHWLKHHGDVGLAAGSRIVVTTAETRDLGFCEHVLRKPFRHSQLRTLLFGEQEQAAQTRARSDILAGRRFLVVEDNDVNQQIMAGLLAMHGAQVDVAENGELGLAAMQSADYDLIFMDGQMPVMDGYDCTRRIREIESGTPKHRTIVATTASATSSEQEECIRSGMDDHVAKPISPATILAVIEKNLP